MIYDNEVFEGLDYEGKLIEDIEADDCIFKNCKFTECDFTRCFISNCKFEGCTIINPKNAFSQVRFSEFKECTFVGIQWAEFTGSNKYQMVARGFQECYMKYNDFANLDLRGVDFSRSQIINSGFRSCNLESSDFKDSNLSETQFTKCNLKKADFRNSMEYQIDIFSCEMRNGKFSFPDAIILLDALGIKID